MRQEEETPPILHYIEESSRDVVEHGDDDRFLMADEALRQVVTIVGTIGSGKTISGKVIEEYLLTMGRRSVVVDPTGVWWGLRLNQEGNGPSPFNIAVLGGDHGDMPLYPNQGDKIARIVAHRNQPIILDLSNMMQDEKIRFMLDFTQALYHHNRQALHLIIDEADEFAPQNPQPEVRRLLHWIDRTVRRGRVKGFRICMITQRPAVLHKNVLTQSNTLIIHRITSPQDRKAIDSWIIGNADAEKAKIVTDSLANLERGSAWLWCPSLNILDKVKFPFITTFDSSRTPDDNEIVAEVELPPLELEALKVELEPEAEPAADETQAEVEEDPAPRGGRRRALPAPASADIEAVRISGIQQGRKEILDGIWPKVSGLQVSINEIMATLADLPHAPVLPPVPLPKPDTAPPRPKDPAKPASPKAADLMLAALPSIKPCSRQDLAIATGLLMTGGGFRRAIKALVDAGKIREDGRGLLLIGERPEGIQPMPADLLLSLWKERISDNAGAGILSHLYRFGGDSTLAETAAAVGLNTTGGGFRRAIKKLRDIGLIKQLGDGAVELHRYIHPVQ